MSNRSYHFILISIFGFIFLFGHEFYLYAQENKSEEFTLEEITVTAQKRAENQQKVAITMDVTSGDEMKMLGLSNIDQVFQSMASVFVNESGDGLRVSIRGISSDERSIGGSKDLSNASPVVAVNTDGVFTFGRKTGANMYDIERVEVLYGPQSTLYSSNSPGGIVNIVTAAPKTDKYEMSAKVDLGNYNNLEAEGMANIPLSDNTALRLSFMSASHDGYMATGLLDADTKSVRGKILTRPNDQLTITVTGQYLLDQGNGMGPGIEMFKNQDDVPDPWDNSGESSPFPKDRKNKDFNLQAAWDFDIGTFTLLASTADMNETSTYKQQDMFTGMEYTHLSKSWSEEKGAEARMASSPDSPVKWILGATTFKFDQDSTGVATDAPFFSSMAFKSNARSKAFYGNVTYPLLDALRLTGGLRWSDDKNSNIFEVISGNVVMNVLESPHYRGWDHKIGLEYDLGKDSMLYADWSTGYRVGAMGGGKEPETMNAYTIGSKNRFLKNSLQVNISAYLYDYTNYPAENMMIDPDTLQRDLGSMTQGDMSMIGADIQTEMLLSAKDRLSLQLSYQDAEFAKLVFDFDSPKLPDISYTGQSPTFTPDWSITAAYEHNFELPNGSSLTARIDTRYQTEQLVSFQETGGSGGPGPQISILGYRDQEAYHLSNIATVYAHPDGKWTMTGYVKNLENYAVKKNLMENKLQIGPPRTYGVIVSLRY